MNEGVVRTAEGDTVPSVDAVRMELSDDAFSVSTLHGYDNGILQ
jgi:hypothetical protein